MCVIIVWYAKLLTYLFMLTIIQSKMKPYIPSEQIKYCMFFQFSYNLFIIMVYQDVVGQQQVKAVTTPDYDG